MIVALIKITVSVMLVCLLVDLNNHPIIGIADKKGTPESVFVVSSLIKPPITNTSPLLIFAIVSMVLLLTCGTIFCIVIAPSSVGLAGSTTSSPLTDNVGLTLKVISLVLVLIDGIISS